MSSTGRVGAGDLGTIFREYMQLDAQRRTGVLSVEELERWSQLKHALNAHFQPGVRSDRADRRGSVRVPVRLTVDFESYGEVRKSLMTNFSRGGLFIATDSPLPMGTPLRIRLQIEEMGQRIELSAEVVSQNIGPDLRSQEAGMGVRFAKLSDSDHDAIDELYRRAFQREMERSGS
jgi:uncharacterized protein (TIGR02266 family)